MEFVLQITDGQILVTDDMLGIWFLSCKKYVKLDRIIEKAVKNILEIKLKISNKKIFYMEQNLENKVI